LRWSLDALFSTVDKEVYLKEQIDFHDGQIAYYTGLIRLHNFKRNELQAELASIQGQGADSEHRNAKRPRTW